MTVECKPIVSPGNILAAEKKSKRTWNHCGLSYTLKLFEKLNYIFLQTAAVVFPWKRMQSIEQQYDSWMQPIVRPGNVLDVEKKSKLTWNIANYRTLYNFLKTDNYTLCETQPWQFRFLKANAIHRTAT